MMQPSCEESILIQEACLVHKPYWSSLFEKLFPETWDKLNNAQTLLTKFIHNLQPGKTVHILLALSQGKLFSKLQWGLKQFTSLPKHFYIRMLDMKILNLTSMCKH